MSKSILALAYEAGIRPFDTVPSLGKKHTVGDLAAALLSGRNPYFDPAYREKWGVRVHSIEVTHDRLAVGCVESAQPTKEVDRRFRAVIFRADGEVLYQTSDNRLLDLDGAVIDLRYHLTHVNEAKCLHDLCIKQVKEAVKMRENAERVLGILAKQGP